MKNSMKNSMKNISRLARDRFGVIWHSHKYADLRVSITDRKEGTILQLSAKQADLLLNQLLQMGQVELTAKVI